MKNKGYSQEFVHLVGLYTYHPLLYLCSLLVVKLLTNNLFSTQCTPCAIPKFAWFVEEAKAAEIKYSSGKASSLFHF